MRGMSAKDFTKSEVVLKAMEQLFKVTVGATGAPPTQARARAFSTGNVARLFGLLTGNRTQYEALLQRKKRESTDGGHNEIRKVKRQRKSAHNFGDLFPDDLGDDDDEHVVLDGGRLKPQSGPLSGPHAGPPGAPPATQVPPFHDVQVIDSYLIKHRAHTQLKSVQEV